MDANCTAALNRCTKPDNKNACPVLPSVQGQTCQGNSGDSVWNWMADNAFGLGAQYKGTTRPNIDFSRVPHGTCLELGCVEDWKYKNGGEKATLQCHDGTFSIITPSNFQQDADHKCK